jgi:hypothetical protein
VNAYRADTHPHATAGDLEAETRLAYLYNIYSVVPAGFERLTLLPPTQVVSLQKTDCNVSVQMNKKKSDVWFSRGSMHGERGTGLIKNFRSPDTKPLRNSRKEMNTFSGEIIMVTMFRFTATFLLLLVLLGNVSAQDESGTKASAPLITATASSQRVRYVSMGEVHQARLQVFSPDGAPVFDSGFRLGNTIDWQLTDQQGARLTDGSYIFLVTVKDFSERVTQKYGTAILEQEQVYLERTNKAQLPPAQATALESSKQSEAFSPVDRIGAAGLNRAATGAPDDRSASNAQPSGSTVNTNLTAGTANLSGNGTTNRVVKWTDGATGTVGDSVIAEENGNIGIGNPNPIYKLDVLRSTTPTMRLMDSAGRFALFGVDSNGATLTDIATAGDFVFRSNNGRLLFTNRGTNGGIIFANGNATDIPRLVIAGNGNVGVGTSAPVQKLEVAGNIKVSGAGNGIVFADGSVMTTAATGAGGTPSGSSLVTAINDPSTVGAITDARLSSNIARLNGQNAWMGQNTFVNGLSANGVAITNVGNPVSATDATNKAYTDANFVKFVPGAEQLSVGDANGTAPMINLRGGSTCCSGPGGHTPAWFKVFQNGSFVATGNLGIGVSPMQGKGYRTSWDSYKGAFRSGYADNEWDDANVGFFSWAGGSNSTAIGLYALAFGDTNSAESTSSIVFGSGNQVKGAAGFSAGAGNRVCDTYGVALGNNAKSGGPIINGKCDPDTFNIRGLAAVAIGYNVTADQDHSMALGKFASNNGFTGTFIWGDGSAQQTADTFRNTANNEFAARATGGFRFRTNLAGTTGCNLPAGSGVFNCTSSRFTKENFVLVQGEDVLTKLRKMPVSTWNYISEGKQVRHIGLMAEDFFEAFRLGTGNTSIGVQDLAGVSLAAVKALDQRTVELQQKTVELQQKTAEVEQLRNRVTVLEERLANIERAMQASGSGSGTQPR